MSMYKMYADFLMDLQGPEEKSLKLIYDKSVVEDRVEEVTAIDNLKGGINDLFPSNKMLVMGYEYLKGMSPKYKKFLAPEIAQVYVVEVVDNDILIGCVHVCYNKKLKKAVGDMTFQVALRCGSNIRDMTVERIEAGAIASQVVDDAFIIGQLRYMLTALLLLKNDELAPRDTFVKEDGVVRRVASTVPTGAINHLIKNINPEPKKVKVLYSWNGEKGVSGIHQKLHTRRGHWRNYKSGKRVWVKEYQAGDISLGVSDRVLHIH